MRCQPNSIYIVGRHIPDPSDLNTYYVRAYVFDARTFTLLDTLNLEDKGNGTHTKEYRLPSDPSGAGRQLLVKTTVFTDSGFTVKSPLYAEELDTELMVISEVKSGGGAGWGGADIDYNKIEKILAERIDGIRKELSNEIKTNKAEKVDFTSLKDTLLEALGSVLLAVKDIKVPEYKEADLAPILSKIEALKKALSDLPDHSKEINKVAQTAIKILSRQDILENKIGKISLPEIITREVEKEVLEDEDIKLQSIRNILND